MKKDVFITGLASFFPNSPVSNDEMEEFLGLISGKHSKVQRIVLKQNGIKRRYYALNKIKKSHIQMQKWRCWLYVSCWH